MTAAGGDSLAATLASLAAEVAAARAAARRPPVRVSLDVASGRAEAVDPGLRAAVHQLLGAACVAAESAPPRLRDVVVTTVSTNFGLEIEVADSGAGPAPDAVAAARTSVERLGGSLSTAACPEGGVAVTLRLPQRRLRSRAA